ncbi:MAG: electron transfer flavoprotein subunit alpha/FixB family protein [Deltaproteobacteria bacterium]|nr:electron transfer flavoprotein subunit alpha/FixB family protein [Deltaproteobacteria bacterium]
MSDKNSIVVIFIEWADDKTILPISLETLNIAKRITDSNGSKLAALVIGCEVSTLAEELKHYGVDLIYTFDKPALNEYQPELYLCAIKKVYQNLQPEVILFGNTLTAIDLAPRFAFELDAGLVTDCVEITFDSNELMFTKPIYSGNVMAVYSFASTPCVATMRSRASEPAKRNEQASGEIIPLDISIDSSLIKTEVIEIISEKKEGVRLSAADIIVAGGRGMGDSEGFAVLEDLARTLGAALGSSRPPCDLEWVSPKTQVGLTGEIVAPSLYIAVGISGSFQHLAGMFDSKTIVAINRDPKANIFKVADYGVVGEFEAVLPAFKETLSGLLNQE